jgi:hypothetical protein
MRSLIAAVAALAICGLAACSLQAEEINFEYFAPPARAAAAFDNAELGDFSILPDVGKVWTQSLPGKLDFAILPATPDKPADAKRKVHVLRPASAKDSCPPCKTAKREGNELEGFEFDEVEDNSIKRYPVIEWTDAGGQVMRVTGWYGKAHFLKMIREQDAAAVRKRASVDPRAPVPVY